MALIIADRVKETTITSGTGTITLSGRTFGGFQTFSGAIGDGNTTYYCIQNEDQFEIGIGTYTAGTNTLSRDTIFQSSNSDNKISINGVGIVFSVVPADRLIYKDESNSVVFPTPFAFKRTDDGDYWQALSTDYTNRVASFFIAEGTDPTWKIGLKTTQSETVAPYYAYVSGKDGFIELRGNSSSILSIGDGASEGLQVTHQLKNIIDIRKNGGEIAIQNLDLNSDETTTAKNTSIGYTVFAVESSVGHISDLQTWSVSTDEKASINQYGDFETVGNIIAPSGRFSAIRFSDGSVQTSAALPASSGSLIDQNTQDIVAISGLLGDVVGDVTTEQLNYVSGIAVYGSGQADINSSNIVAVSGFARDYVDSQDHSAAAVSGYLEPLVNSNQQDISTVSGLLTPSGESFNFNSNILTYNNSYGGSFSTDLSSLSSFDTSGVSLSYNAGVLTYTNNAGGSFGVDISSISGDIYSLIVDGAPATLDTLNEIAAALNNDSGVANTLINLINTTSGNLQTQITGNDSDILQLNIDISTVSGLLYDDSAISGYFESRVDENELQIVAVSGWARDYVDSQDHSAVSVSGTLQPQITQNTSDIAVVSGLLSTATERFSSDIIVSLGGGKTFGRYEDGDTIPASGKTANEVISLAITEPIAPTASLTSSSSVDFNQTSVSVTLNFSHTINSLGATVSSASLEFRRGNTGSWTVLSTSTSSSSSYTHTFTDTAFNTSQLNYRYTVTDSVSATTTVTKNINPDTYSSPSISFSVVADSTTSPETNSSRERGNVASTISGTISSNETYIDLTTYTLQYSVDNGAWTDIGSAQSISGQSATISSTAHDPTSDNTATSIRYRVKVVDDYTTSYSSVSTVSFGFLAFHGPSSSVPTTSSAVRSLPSRFFTSTSDVFNLNTGSTEVNFTVAIPSTETISEVIDLDALNANITSQYVNNNFNVDDAGGTAVSYNVYTMTQASAYSSNHRHQVTKG